MSTRSARRASARHENDLVTYAHERLREINSLRIVGTAKHKGALVSFDLNGAHPHDFATIIDRSGVAVRAGTHCAMPLLERFGVPATCRASFALYNTREEVDLPGAGAHQGAGVLHMMECSYWFDEAFKYRERALSSEDAEERREFLELAEICADVCRRRRRARHRRLSRFATGTSQQRQSRTTTQRKTIMTIALANPPAADRAAPEAVVMRFAGDSGDGIQLTGGQFTLSTALAGNDLATFPDFPAEIRAPQGTTFGVSAFQINFGSTSIDTAGDAPDVLMAMNPAALKVNLPALRPGGLIIADTGALRRTQPRKGGLQGKSARRCGARPVPSGGFRHHRLTLEAVKPLGLGNRDGLRCKAMWALGLTLWMFGRDRGPLIEYLKTKFGAKGDKLVEANIAALNAGHAYGETAEIGQPLKQVRVPRAEMAPGLYRTVTGSETVALGLVAGSQLAGLPLFLGSYPITPASPILHHLSKLKEYDVTSFQAEDEIAAICSAIGASYAGQLGVTSSSGPGIALKGEAIGLAIISELPLVIVNCQRGGPSTGLPTKTEQSDLYQAVYGRNGDAPLVVIAARSPSDCFEVAIEAVRLAVQFMTPVMLLTDGYIANAAEPWRVPDMEAYKSFPTSFFDAIPAEGKINPYQRDPETLKRIWIKPGTSGLTHRIGGIEKGFDTGEISYDAANHQKMTDTRKAKIDGIANHIPPQEVSLGETSGKLAVVGWGSTFGPIQQAVRRARARGADVSHIHIRYLWPLPSNLESLLRSYERVLVPEMNTGQLKTILRDQYLIDAKPLNKVSGQPFMIAEIEAAIDQALA